MNLSIFQQTKPVGAGHSLVMAIYKASAPTTVVASYQLSGPYTGQTQLHSFTGLLSAAYKYQLFESPDGTPTGTVRNYFDVQPNVNAYATRDDLYLTADISAFFASGVNSYGADSSLVGWIWSLERVGQGTRQIGNKYLKTIAGIATTADDTNADGWKTVDPLDLIAPNEEWVIHFYPQLQAVSSSTTGSMISATRILTANTTLDSSAIGQSFWLKGAGGYFDVTLPDLATVPDNEPLYFMSDGGSHINVGLKCFAGQSIQWYPNQSDLASDTRANKLILGQQEKAAFYKFTLPDSSVRWMILYGGEDAKKVGEVIMNYSKIEINMVLAAGQLLSRANYARLWAWVQTLEAGALISDGSLGATSILDGVSYFINHGKYTMGDGSTTFRVPLLTSGTGSGTGFLRMIDGTTRIPGSFQADALEDHQHESTAGTLPTPLFGEGPSRTKGNYGGQAAGRTDLVSGPGLIVGGTYQSSQKLSYETRPVNFGAYGLIRI